MLIKSLNKRKVHLAVKVAYIYFSVLSADFWQNSKWKSNCPEKCRHLTADPTTHGCIKVIYLGYMRTLGCNGQLCMYGHVI